jgi:hypothetical protein
MSVVEARNCLKGMQERLSFAIFLELGIKTRLVRADVHKSQKEF